MKIYRFDEFINESESEIFDQNSDNEIKKLMGTKFAYKPIEYCDKNPISLEPVEIGPHNTKNNYNHHIINAINKELDPDKEKYNVSQDWTGLKLKKESIEILTFDKYFS